MSNRKLGQVTDTLGDLTGNPFAQRQVLCNRQTRDAWWRCQAHRKRITALLLSAADPVGGRLCVLGAGNCNDLDFSSLRHRIAEIHLVDIDADAVRAGISHQMASEDHGFVVHAPFDLTGVLDRLAAYSVTSGNVTELLAEISRSASGLPGPFDIVLSAGVMTQLFQCVADLKLPARASLALILGLRLRHLKELLELTRPGGRCILVSDVVSTASAPYLRKCAEDELPGLLAKLIEQRNFFTGANPAAMWQQLIGDPSLRVLFTDIETYDPWLWPVSTSHAYLTWALSLRRAS